MNKIDEASDKVQQRSWHFLRKLLLFEASPIPELGGFNESKKQKLNDDDDIPDDTEDAITFKNPPVMTWVHYDNEEKVDIVNMALPVISGSENVDFNLSEDGSKLIVNYTWPTLITVPRVLFCRKVQNMPLSHLRINGMSAKLVKREISEKSKPTGSIIVRLPMKVQREVYFEGMQMNNTDAILINFKAFQKKTVIDDANTKVKIE